LLSRRNISTGFEAAIEKPAALVEEAMIKRVVCGHVSGMFLFG